ncbi:hypothetical protein C5B42_03410 [Candidatus Cerribacteria bacterium 'Amazon FNV 2010 28 9']|uniref:Dihydroorotate dehydrogenase (quinone) n=1 Tax=Candidatus Cerribacteria bacterium 'Amazon FNV 2010 28 9' TaxID=2081795 RepID=A0A317JQ04_9BACT|nr:MAG: hypothetical protein C5B42_03410 [Candidatus Cerribacteria bacterium 'Amazon FNV 2010 28 9']
MKLLIKLLIVIVSFLGIIDASFLSYEKLTGHIPPCTVGFQCDTVLTSKWSILFGVPLPLYGLAFYGFTFVIAVLHFLEIDHISIDAKRKLHTADLQLILAMFGICFSLYLVSIMGLVLHAWCLYCLLSALCCLTLFVLNVMQWHMQKKICVCSASSPKTVIFSWLYAHIAKPLFFMIDAEVVHIAMTRVGAFLGRFALSQQLTRWMFFYGDKQLATKVDGIVFPNPVGLAAGFDYEGRLGSILPSVGFGFHTIGTVTYRSYEGNEPPRLGRFPDSKALLVNKGFKSEGAPAIIDRLKGKKFAIPTGISIGSTNAVYATLNDQIDDIVKCFKLFEASTVKHAYYELNISCPNTQGGQPFTTPQRLNALLTKLKNLHIKRPVYIKMPIDLSQKETNSLLQIASAYSFIKGVIFGNLTKDHSNPDVAKHDRDRWNQVKGNLSGKPTWNRSNALIAFTKKKYGKRFTIIGTGGIFTPEDAQTKLELGADLVQLITGMIYEGPQLIGEINRHFSKVAGNNLKK